MKIFTSVSDQRKARHDDHLPPSPSQKRTRNEDRKDESEIETLVIYPF
jgi:hypothetical protein